MQRILDFVSDCAGDREKERNDGHATSSNFIGKAGNRLASSRTLVYTRAAVVASERQRMDHGAIKYNCRKC